MTKASPADWLPGSRPRRDEGGDRFPRGNDQCRRRSTRRNGLVARSWCDRPFQVVVGYPTDALCSAVISRIGQHAGLFLHDHLGALNCYVLLEYEVPASISSDEMTTVNLAAGEYVRRVVDVLRVAERPKGTKVEDGILHFARLHQTLQVNASDGSGHQRSRLVD